LLGLVTFIASRRTKEIGIRKVVGASVRQIIMLLLRDFIGLVLIAFMISIPISWYGLDTWLEAFAYRTNFGFMAIAAGCLAVSMFALATITYQSVKAAIGNPVESLRSE
jgi:putative ABC transport system permease protein